MVRQQPIARAVRGTALPHLAAHTAPLPAVMPPAERVPRCERRPRAASADQAQRRPGGRAFHARITKVRPAPVSPTEPPHSTPPARAATSSGADYGIHETSGTVAHADDVLGLALRITVPKDHDRAAHASQALGTPGILHPLGALELSCCRMNNTIGATDLNAARLT